jgi:hypothetical protein
MATTALSPDPSGPGRATLVLRRRSETGSTLRSAFVTLFEPVAPGVAPLTRVGRVRGGDDVVAVAVETADGLEHVVVSRTPGSTIRVRLSDGRLLVTDGLAARLGPTGLVLAGGSYAETAGLAARRLARSGRVVRAVRSDSATADEPGWFETDRPLPEPESLAGRVVLIHHGDGPTRGWTIARAENLGADGGCRLFVREDPAFHLERSRGAAVYERAPGGAYPGPHRFDVSTLVRGVPTTP